MSVRDYVAAIKAEYRRERELRAALKTEARARGARFRAARERLRVQLWRGVLWPFRPCPTPGVEAFRDLRDVDVAAVAVMRASNNRVLAGGHRCECGYWHLTTRPAEREWEDDQ